MATKKVKISGLKAAQSEMLRTEMLRVDKDEKRQEKLAQIDIMKWQVERWEVANISILDRALSLTGFSVIELALLVQLATSDTKKLTNWERNWLEFTFLGILFALIFFMIALVSKSDGDSHENKNFIGQSLDNILIMLSQPDTTKGENPTNTVEISEILTQESLQSKENLRRHWPLTTGMMCLGVSQVFLSFIVGLRFGWL